MSPGWWCVTWATQWWLGQRWVFIYKSTNSHTHTHTHTYFSLKHPFQTSTLSSYNCYSSGLIHTDWWFWMITNHHLDPQSTHFDSLVCASHWMSVWVRVRVCVHSMLIIHLALGWLTHAGSQGFVKKRVVPSYMKFYHAGVQLCTTKHVTCASLWVGDQVCVLLQNWGYSKGVKAGTEVCVELWRWHTTYW